MPKIVAGLDLSLTSTGYSVLEGDCILERGRLGVSYKDFRRVVFIADEIEQLCKKRKPELVCIEGYSFASQNHRLADLGELGGLTKYKLIKLGVPWLIVSPNQLKKFVTGKGSGKKNVVIMHTYKKYGVEFESDDECDAYVLARIAQACSEDFEKLDKAQTEVVNKIMGR